MQRFILGGVLMDTDFILRSANINDYPELFEYKKNQLYDGFIGCGGMFLLNRMIKKMNLKSGDVLLDLGCGLGAASVYLTKHFNITVVAIDLWNPINVINDNIVKESLMGSVIPLQLDITQVIPFADNYFDAIFSMNALFMFGDNLGFLYKLLKTLKIGGTFCIGSECFNQEPDENMIEVFGFNWKWDVWKDCFSRYHSPKWWESLLCETKQLNIDYCEELEDSIVLWEDMTLNYEEYFGHLVNADAMIPKEKFIDYIAYGKHNDTYLSLFILSGTKIADL